jgi:hypothetical protein
MQWQLITDANLLRLSIAVDKKRLRNRQSDQQAQPQIAGWAME